MGRNSYLGGSTILHGGSSLFSKDKNSKRNRVINAEKDFLLRCVRADLAGKKYPQSYSEHEKLRASITKAGGVSEWLKAHPDYSKLKDRELKKLEKRSAENKKKKERLVSVKKKQSENAEKRAKRELAYLKDFIWSQIVEREAPKSKPKGFEKKYPSQAALLEWAKSHEKYEEIYMLLLSKRKKQIDRIEQSKNNNVEVVVKKSRNTNTKIQK